MWVEGECSWCRQCGREGVREERVRGRRERERDREMGGRGDRYSKGRFDTWG